MTKICNEVDLMHFCENLPKEAVDECSSMGSNDDSCHFWVTKTNMNIDVNFARSHIKHWGIEGTEDMNYFDLCTYLMWLGCHDVKDSLDECDDNS